MGPQGPVWPRVLSKALDVTLHSFLKEGPGIKYVLGLMRPHPSVPGRRGVCASFFLCKHSDTSLYVKLGFLDLETQLGLLR